MTSSNSGAIGTYHAMASRISALRAFALNLAARIDGVINHCLSPLHTGLLEGINNKIKVLKRMTYGFRDDAYFFRENPRGIPRNSVKNQKNAAGVVKPWQKVQWCIPTVGAAFVVRMEEVPDFYAEPYNCRWSVVFRRAPGPADE